MRFSLRTLLLMFPVIVLLAYGLACAIAFVQVAPERPGSTVDRIGLCNDALILNQAQTKAGLQTDISTLELWLQGKLPWTHPDFKIYAANLSQQQDIWGRNLHCVALSPSGQPLPDATLANNVGLYSLGRDGKSLSHGLDADDVNSWSTTLEQTQALGNAWVHERMHEQAGYYMPWILGALLLIQVGMMWIKSPCPELATETKN
jgi:hypothetical protein